MDIAVFLRFDVSEEDAASFIEEKLGITTELTREHGELVTRLKVFPGGTQIILPIWPVLRQTTNPES